VAKKQKRPKSVVLLDAYTANEVLVEHAELSIHDYYDESPRLVDDSNYRAVQGIRHIAGKIYDSSGTLKQSFDSYYNELGEYVRSRAVHDDGTITED
jgi:hypothetical protein